MAIISFKFKHPLSSLRVSVCIWLFAFYLFEKLCNWGGYGIKVEPFDLGL